MTSLSVDLQQSHGIPLDVSFTCPTGEVMAIVGPSGSGKTTVLRTIAGLIEAEKGHIHCRNEVWFDTDRGIHRSPQHRHVGLVFQNYALFPHLTVFENIQLALAKDAMTSVDELLQLVNLNGLADRKPATLSGGQQQRVALARALARTLSPKPAALLLDEPFSAVDQVTRRKLRLELKGLIRQLDMPIVLVTHDLEEASVLADQICVLHNGKSLQSGKPEAVLRAPNSALIARLMDVRNVFKAEIIDQNTMRWAGQIFSITPSFPVEAGDEVDWCISADKVLLHRRVNPSKGIRENPVYGEIIECIESGGLVNVLIKIQESEAASSKSSDQILHMDLPRHVLERNTLAVGDQIGMSLLTDAIHIMTK